MKVKRGKGEGEKEKKVKKMRKAKVKLITALSLTVVMLAAMTGIAAADGVDLIRFEGTITNADGSPYNGVVEIQKDDGGSWNSLGSVNTDSSTGWYQIPQLGYYGPTNKDDTYRLFLDGTQVDEQTITGTGWTCDVQTQCWTGWSYKWDYQIPEFATVAIPMGIAILSGLFFLNHRKRREE